MPLASLSPDTQNKLLTQYYDDWYALSNTDPTLTQGQDFDFQRILFRPRYGVQSRELTQLQTILQAQLQSLGAANFKNGQSVLGGEIAIDTTVISGKVLALDNVAAFFDRTLNYGEAIIKSDDETIKATVRQFVAADEGTTTDNYLLFKYESDATFAAAQAVTAVSNATVTATFATGGDVFSPASTFSIESGVFFIAGFFVRVKPQTIVLNPFSDQPNAIVGLRIIEEFLDELDDVVGDTLLDPANQNAVGAHRLRLRLELDSYGLDADVPANFITLATIVNGIVQKGNVERERFVRWSELNDILARRTYDESGDYMIRPFPPVIGAEPNVEDHFRLSLGPGKAYVHGYEAETTEPTHLMLRKGRETETVNNSSLALQVGNFAYVTRLAAAAPMNYFANIGTVSIHCVNVASINVSTQASTDRSRIGEVKVRLTETHDVPPISYLTALANNTIYKLFFYDTTFDTLTGNCAGGGTSNAGIVSVPIAAANGIPLVNGALVGVTVVLSGSSSPVSGTFTIDQYVANATHANVTFKQPLPTIPNSSTQWRLLFQPKDIDAFAVWTSGATFNTPYTANLSFQADVDLIEGKLGSGTSLSTIVEGASRNALLYELPNKFIVADSLVANNTTWEAWLQTDANTEAMSGNGAVVTLTVSETGATFPEGNIADVTAQRLLIIFDETADIDGRGQVIQFEDNPNTSVRCISNVNATSTGSGQYEIAFFYNHGAASGNNRTFRAIARTTMIAHPIRQKSLVLGNTTAALSNTTGAILNGQIEYHSLNVDAGYGYSLKVPDAFRIVQVLYKSSNTDFVTADLTTATDVTNKFTLDNGQRDNSYEYARAITGKTANRVIKPEGRLLFIFDWFQHSGRGFATVDSYLSAVNVQKGMTYDIVPSYTSTRTGRTASLRDTLDFRAVRTTDTIIDAANTIYAANATGIAANTDSTYLTSTGKTYLIPASDGIWIGDYEYYLGRKDQIGVGFDGVFRVIEGTDAIAPQPPVDDTGSLLLFQIDIPPYTLVDADGKPITTTLTTFDYKRYTMKDISKVENRVAHLEYYTALNSLETITKNQTIVDGEGNERFKNGIVADGFHGGDVGDVSSPDFTASIDSRERELRTAFRSYNMGFSADTYGDITGSTSYGITLVGDMAIPTYNTAPFITQPFATHAVSVNPFNIASFYGNVRLNPAVDIWKDTNTLPAQVIDMGGPTEAWVKANLPSYTVWGEWDQTWSGVTGVQTQRSWFTPEGWTPEDHGFRSMTELSWQDVETSTVYQRQGTAYEYVVQTTNQSMGNRVVDTNIIHVARKRDIVITADGMKSATPLYAFFDGQNVDNYVQRGNLLELADIAQASMPSLFVGQTVYVKKAITGDIFTTNGSTTLVGNNTVFQYELVPGQLVQVTQGATNGVMAYVTSVTNNTAATLSLPQTPAWSNAVLYTLTPVTIVEVSPRYSTSNVTTTLRVARAVRDTDIDQGFPYPVTAGSLRVTKHVWDPGTSTNGAILLVPASPQCAAAELTITDATCYSGVVRSFNSLTGAVRFDLDIVDDLVATGATVRFVSGPGAGQSATVTTYSAANQTAILDTPGLLDITAGETIYSVGRLTTDGFVNATPIIAGRAGCAGGVFHLPADEFATGTRLFRLTDQANNVPRDATTAAETNYESSGLSVTQQETSVSSRSVTAQRVGPRMESFSVTSQSVQNLQIAYVDPLAESFVVDAKAYPQGVFIASVDLCFESVPDIDVPVIVELRTVVNGYPSSAELVPCCGGNGLAQVTLRRDQVKTAAVPNFAEPLTVTTFTLPAPVHLLPGKEYAIVVRSDSDEYRVFTAELGATVLGTTDIKVSSQPYAGSFFKSQNASTWTESPFEDLMFRLNRAVWVGTATTPQESMLVARGVPPSANLMLDSVEFYPHDVHFTDVTGASYTLGILPMNANTGDLTGQVAIYYPVPSSEWLPLAVRSMVMGRGNPEAAANGVLQRALPSFNSNILGSANTVDAMITLATWSADVAPYVDMKKINMLYVVHQINNMGLQADDILFNNPGAGYKVTKRSSAVGNTVDTTATSPNVSLTSGGSVDVTLYLQTGDSVWMGNGTVNVVSTVLSVTNSSHFVATANVGQTLSGAHWYTFGGDLDGNNSTITLTITSDEGEDAAGYATIGRNGQIESVTLTANGVGYTDTPLVTVPAPDVVAGFDAAIQSQAYLSYSSELSATGGNGLTRYFTRSVTLADGFEARDLKVWFDAYRPVGSKFYVYYKVLAVDKDTERFADQPWRLMTQVTNDSVISTRWSQFKEFEFKTATERALDAATDTSDTFKTFAVKLVMATENTVNAPRVANFRAIALDN